MLAAEYDRINRKSGAFTPAIDLHRWDRSVYDALYQLGFFQLLGFNEQILTANVLPPVLDPEVFMVPMQCGADTNLVSAGEVLLRLFGEAGGDLGLRVRLFGAVADAVENVRGHAYRFQPKHVSQFVPPLWWLGGAVKRSERELSLTIYDQGVTIPFMLPRTNSASSLTNLFKEILGIGYDPDTTEHDGDALRAAMQLSATSTGLRERGKGLSKIRDAVANCDGGKMRLTSRRGNYVYDSGFERYYTSRIPLQGTLLEIQARF